MNPYKVLGVDPSATIDQIEISYRQLLRAHHPDVHHAGSPADLAAAEQRTRELNEAMALIRAGWRPRPEGPTTWPRWRTDEAVWRARAERWEAAFRGGADTDWFGHPYHDGRVPRQVHCPLCRRDFDDAARFHRHLTSDHHLREDTFVAAPKVHAERMHWLVWVPAPPLTFGALFFVYLTVVVHALSWPWTAPAIWFGVIVTTLALLKSMLGRHSS